MGIHRFFGWRVPGPRLLDGGRAASMGEECQIVSQIVIVYDDGREVPFDPRLLSEPRTALDA
jgi:hypothetical protein